MKQNHINVVIDVFFSIIMFGMHTQKMTWLMIKTGNHIEKTSRGHMITILCQCFQTGWHKVQLPDCNSHPTIWEMIKYMQIVFALQIQKLIQMMIWPILLGVGMHTSVVFA